MLDINLKLGLSYPLLMISIFGLFIFNYFHRIKTFRLQISFGLFLISYIFFFIFGYLAAVSLLFISLFVVMCFLFTLDNRITKVISFMGIAVMSVALAMFMLPGFNNQVVINNFKFSQASSNYRLYFNFDYPLVGLFIIFFTHTTMEKIGEWKQIFSSTYKYYLLIILLLLLSIAGGDSKFDFKPHIFLQSEFYIWFVIMLLCTCVGEEAFFRGFLQKNIAAVLKFKYSDYGAILVVAFLFGLVHMKYGPYYTGLAFIASIFYGIVYYKSGNKIESSIFAHFLVNFIRLVFLTYPQTA